MVTALILGIIEGLTEFLPISSTGHLILAGSLLHFTGERAATFEIFIQLGAILAVAWVYRAKFLQLLNFSGSTDGFAGGRGIKLLVITTIPAVILGAPLDHFIKVHLFNPMTVALGLAGGGLIIILFERARGDRGRTKLDGISNTQALKVGLAQVLSLWPGVSRAGATILGGMASNLDRETAVEYSFLAAVPVMIAATAYDLLKGWHSISPSDFRLIAIGFVAAFVSAIIAIKFFLRLLKSTTLEPFGWYRLVIAAAVLLLIRA